MKTRLGALLLVGLAVLTLTGGCNGADNVTGRPDPGQGNTTTPPPQDGTPRPRVTPDPCRQFPADCD
jgi:hypothetical protein